MATPRRPRAGATAPHARDGGSGGAEEMEKQQQKQHRRLRPFRLRGAGSPRKFGVAAGSLSELLRKGCRLMELPLSGSRLCLYEDGTELTENYFRTLPAETELVLLGPGESWEGCASEILRLLLDLSSQKVIEAAREMLSSEKAAERQKVLVDLIQNLSENIQAEEKEKDRKWFEGLESRFKNKSSYLRYSCQSRMRSYLRQVISYTSYVDPTARDAYKKITDLMGEKLKSMKYNGSYFDRREEKALRLCTPEGWFSCQGPFDSDHCPLKHSINPYSNRESRILFSTWNLDHIIEKKRVIVPELAEAVKKRNGREVNWEYFYQLLFTMENLKLVNIACHEKLTHNLHCDNSRIYT
ncbi:DNA fragmentation factor subunit beta isoform X1 [Calypte anna]|uniref:DNA fragmentation factor subunit beta isoform X1 n=1 Tax=Calypte anna TaxID=9244 RepID=UPI0011C41972|nr:DNA fragmentation factor subunit beta isoform X1 [Calypte anna]